MHRAVVVNSNMTAKCVYLFFGKIPCHLRLFHAVLLLDTPEKLCPNLSKIIQNLSKLFCLCFPGQTLQDPCNLLKVMPNQAVPAVGCLLIQICKVGRIIQVLF